MLGIMQGRLSRPTDGRFQCFPRDTWRQEIELAPLAGLDAIEWIFDQHGDGANPIETDPGIEELTDLCTAHGVTVESVCADWFMEERLIGGTAGERLNAEHRLDWLLGRGERLGITRIVLPFVDASALSTPVLQQQARAAIERALPRARSAGIELHLETSLGPRDFVEFLEGIPDPLVKVNYDIGNSSGIGYKPEEELKAYGGRLGSVHIKDRLLGGTTVALGTGSADFSVVATELDRIRYGGPFILQAARGDDGDELALAQANVAFARDLLQQL